ncbi:hypothetical protein AVEN_22607-1, partial [Araneus ventricosus]
DNSLNHFHKNICDRCGLVLKSRLSGRKVPESKPDSSHIRRIRDLLHAKSYIVVAKRPPVSVVRKLGEGVPAQVSPSSFDSSSKLRGPSQNACRAASERSVHITELNCKQIDAMQKIMLLCKQSDNFTHFLFYVSCGVSLPFD